MYKYMQNIVRFLFRIYVKPLCLLKCSGEKTIDSSYDTGAFKLKFSNHSLLDAQHCNDLREKMAWKFTGTMAYVFRKEMNYLIFLLIFTFSTVRIHFDLIDKGEQLNNIFFCCRLQCYNIKSISIPFHFTFFQPKKKRKLILDA